MRRSIAVCGLSLLAAVSFSGCTSMIGGLLPHHDDALKVAAAGDAAESLGTVQVVLKTENDKTKQYTLPLTPQMSLQNALEQTGAIRKFKDMEIKVYRVTPQSKGQVVPLQAEYDAAKNCVPVLHDMALHDGDKVLLQEVDESQIELMLQRLTGNAAKRREWK